MPVVLWQGKLKFGRGDNGLFEHRLVYNPREKDWVAETSRPDAMGNPAWAIAKDSDEVMILDSTLAKMAEYVTALEVECP